MNLVPLVLLLTTLSLPVFATTYICNTAGFGEFTVNIEDKLASQSKNSRSSPDTVDLAVEKVVPLGCPDCYDVHLAQDSRKLFLT